MQGRKLRRSRSDRMLAGVCGGLGEFFGISSTLIRILFVFIPSNLLVYILCAIIIPEE